MKMVVSYITNFCAYHTFSAVFITFSVVGKLDENCFHNEIMFVVKKFCGNNFKRIRHTRPQTITYLDNDVKNGGN